MTSPENKRCLYEVLNVSRDCTADEIRSAYRKLALQRHPDKLIKSGVTEAEATSSFQELVNAYEVLSDARERAWYDSHRSQILFSGKNTSSSSSTVPDLFSYFSNSVFNGFGDRGKGFYKVYGDVFDRIYRNELNFAKTMSLGANAVKEAPLMGNLDSEYGQVNAFYSYWLGFVTVMDFVWADEYDAMNGPNRKSRRVMEEENKKIRKKARREYNETVRGLAEFVKKRDKRVIDMQVKRNEEIERRREEERLRKKEVERLKKERAMAKNVGNARKQKAPKNVYVEDEVEEVDLMEYMEYNNTKGRRKRGGRKETAKKDERAPEIVHEPEISSNVEADEKCDDGSHIEEPLPSEPCAENGNNGGGDDAPTVKQAPPVKVSSKAKLPKQAPAVKVTNKKEVNQPKPKKSTRGMKKKGTSTTTNSGHECDTCGADFDSRKNVGNTRKQKAPKNVYVEAEVEEVDLMEYMKYNNTKGRRKRGGRKETAKKDEREEPETVHEPEICSNAEADEKCDDGSHIEEPLPSEPCAENGNNGGGDDAPTVKQAPPVKVSSKAKVPKQAPAVKVTNKKEVKAKKSTRGMKKKGTSTTTNSGHECDTCGADFDSSSWAYYGCFCGRNKLHKHLSDTGHAALKSR
ncbi:dnaJ domain-containing protein [Artemisia annua]|uniref:DnaJ domain-containing protein n=1 Tax=Artemisia annua TaxID=35608 RepID=A0A2U1QPG3_ARTAN|nr:dnaJ domain-containing protein [Artemisia annua]